MDSNTYIDGMKYDSFTFKSLNVAKVAVSCLKEPSIKTEITPDCNVGVTIKGELSLEEFMSFISKLECEFNGANTEKDT